MIAGIKQKKRKYRDLRGEREKEILEREGREAKSNEQKYREEKQREKE